MFGRTNYDLAGWGMLLVSLGLLYQWVEKTTDTQRILYLMASWTAWLWAIAFAIVMPAAAAWKTRDFALFRRRPKQVLLGASTLVLLMLITVEALRDA